MGPTTHIMKDQLMLCQHFIIVNWLMHTSYEYTVSFRLVLIVYKFTTICKRDGPTDECVLILVSLYYRYVSYIGSFQMLTMNHFTKQDAKKNQWVTLTPFDHIDQWRPTTTTLQRKYDNTFS